MKISRQVVEMCRQYEQMRAANMNLSMQQMQMMELWDCVQELKKAHRRVLDVLEESERQTRIE